MRNLAGGSRLTALRGDRKLSRRYTSTRINLNPNQFGDKEQELARINSRNETSISTFKYKTGVPAVRIRQEKNLELILLPFQGHQIWDLKYYRWYNNSEGYHSIKMKSMFKEPIPVQNTDPWDYLRTYGGFFIHCGVLAMGAPGEGDNHGLHGELPNGIFKDSYIEYNDESQILSLYGVFENKKQFDYNYRFISRHDINLKESDLVTTTCQIENLYHKPMRAMYLAHINFRPELDGKLLYSSNPNDVIIRSEIPAHISATPEYVKFLADLEKKPSLHETLDANMFKLMDTEIVMTYHKYEEIPVPGQEEKWCVTLQKLKSESCGGDDGGFVVFHKNSTLKKVVRWMVADPAIEALGMCLPATSQPNGQTKAYADGEYVTIDKCVDGNPGILQYSMKYGYQSSSKMDGLVKAVSKFAKKRLSKL